MSCSASSWRSNHFNGAVPALVSVGGDPVQVEDQGGGTGGGACSHGPGAAYRPHALRAAEYGVRAWPPISQLLRASAYPYRRGLDWLRSIADEHTALADVIVEREITAVDSDEALADFERGRMGRVRSSRLGKRRNRPRA